MDSGDPRGLGLGLFGGPDGIHGNVVPAYHTRYGT